MGVLRMVLAEIAGRPVNCALSVLAVAVAVTLFIGGQSLLRGYTEDTRNRLQTMQQETDQALAKLDDETRRLMRDLGVNLRIVHQQTNMGSLYTNFEAYDFPEDYVQRLASASQIETIVHVLAILQHKFMWNDRPIFLTGVLPVLTKSQKNEEKPHMVKEVQRGTVVVGHYLGQGRQVGQTLEIAGRPFTIADIRPEQGTEADVQLLIHLHDAQQVLDKPGQVNQILALNCKCKGDRISVIRREVESVLPDTRVTENENRATTRERQRDIVAENRRQEMSRLKESRERQEGMLAAMTTYVSPLAVLVSALFVGLLTWLNVRERRGEIGLLRALGKTTTNIAALFLLKSIFLGLIGGAIGCLLGALLARGIGLHALEIPAQFFSLDLWLIFGTTLGAAVVAAMASYLPMLSAVMQDPALVLVEQ